MLADTSGDVEHADLTLIVDDLEKVTVPGDDIDRHRRRARERPDHVVGLVAVLADDGDAQGVEDGQDQRTCTASPSGTPSAAVFAELAISATTASPDLATR